PPRAHWAGTAADTPSLLPTLAAPGLPKTAPAAKTPSPTWARGVAEAQQAAMGPS
nr:hypothetical protein [Tanacetum cinerariifolium]